MLVERELVGMEGWRGKDSTVGSWMKRCAAATDLMISPSVMFTVALGLAITMANVLTTE